jgi:hypothetical protein
MNNFYGPRIFADSLVILHRDAGIVPGDLRTDISSNAGCREVLPKDFANRNPF